MSFDEIKKLLTTPESVVDIKELEALDALSFTLREEQNIHNLSKILVTPAIKRPEGKWVRGEKPFDYTNSKHWRIPRKEIGENYEVRWYDEYEQEIYAPKSSNQLRPVYCETKYDVYELLLDFIALNDLKGSELNIERKTQMELYNEVMST